MTMTTTAQDMLRLYRHVMDVKRDGERQLLYEEISERAKSLAALSKRMQDAAAPAPATLLRAAAETVWEQSEHITQLAQGVLHPFMLFVIGMGNYGKSTLINSVVGGRVAAMDTLPKTWKIDVFSAQLPKNQVRVRYLTGEEKLTTIRKARALLAKEEALRKLSERRVEGEYNRRVGALKTVEEKVELRTLLRRQFLYVSSVSEVHWPCPASPLLERFDIVDTPGLVQVLQQEVLDDLRTFYHKADGVLWMLDATTISALHSKQLIDDLDESLGKVGGYTDNIIAVLNRVDLADDGAGGARVLAEAQRIFGTRFRQIVPFSAKLALQAVEAKDTAGMEAAGLNQLTRAIDEHFLSRAIALRAAARMQGTRGYINDAVDKTNEFLANVTADERKRRELKAALEADLARVRLPLESQIEAAVSQYHSSVYSNISSRAERLFYCRSEDERESFVEESIFEQGYMRRIASSLAEQVREQAKITMVKHYRPSIFTEFKHLDVLSLPERMGAQIPVNAPSVAMSEFDTSGTALLSGFLAGGAGLLFLGPIGAIIGALAFTSIGRGIAIRKKLPDLQSRLRAELTSTVASLECRLRQTMTEALEYVEQQIVEAREESFAALYGPPQQIPAALSAIEAIPFIAERSFEQLTVTGIMLREARADRHLPAVVAETAVDRR